MTSVNETEKQRRVNRRKFLAGAATAGAVASTLLVTPGEAKGEGQHWDFEADVVVVGTGAAAAAAAAKALQMGSRVIMVEKAPVWGGTSAKSGAWYWIPNNSLMRGMGLSDPRDDAIRYMARMAYPAKYIPHEDRLGLTELEYSLLATFYDRGSGAIDDFAAMGALHSQIVGGAAGPVFDYGAILPEDKAPRGRALQPKDGVENGGMVMMRSFRQFITGKGAQILLRHRAVDVMTNDGGDAMGIRVESSDGEKTIRARRGIVFGSGGFTHNLAYRQAFLKGPVFGGCAVPTNEGDFVRIGINLGAQLGNMSNAWWGECVVEEALQAPSFGQTVFIAPGASMFYVNRLGHRVVDEHMPYNERTQIHFAWDASRYEYINRILFMVFDEATRTGAAGLYPVPGPGAEPHWLLKADSFAGLAAAIQQRLTELAPQLGAITLDHNFLQNLIETNRRFSTYAKAGIDPEFRRDGNAAGRTLSAFDVEKDASYSASRRVTQNQATLNPDAPHHAMRPLSARGPYYSIMLGAGTLDTKGGPVIDAKARVLRGDGTPIPGLYGAGNCIASPAAQTYFAGGSTIGLALTYGYIAGEEAANSPVRSA